jgi:DNA repair protein RadC
MRGAVNFVLAHNHPSGNAQPSQTDLQITQSLHYACTLINIRFLDHIIIAKDGYYSFRQSGFLE